MSSFSIRRVAILLAVLLVETLLTASLLVDGWLGTGSHLRLVASAAAAALPLVIAAAFLFRHRFRFGLRAALAGMALVALFMFISVRPLLDAYEARRASRLLAAAGVKLETESRHDDFFVQIGYDPRLPRVSASPRGQIPVWLRPLAGDLNDHPPDDAVVDVWLQQDAQAAAFAQAAPRLTNLEAIGVSGVSARGMDQLKSCLRGLPRLSSVSVNNDTPVPATWLASLTSVRMLSVWAEGPRMGAALASSQLEEIAGLPNLQVLLVFGYDVDDANIQRLARSKSLRRVVLKHTNVTERGKRQLMNAMPHCEVLGETRLWLGSP